MRGQRSLLRSAAMASFWLAIFLTIISGLAMTVLLCLVIANRDLEPRDDRDLLAAFLATT
jgi:hypothetical protein